MARQVDASLKRVKLLLRVCTTPRSTRRFLYTFPSSNLSNFEIVNPSTSFHREHQSLVTRFPTHQALERVRSLLQLPQRRMLLLTAASESPVRQLLERDSSAFELDRLGHGIFGVCEFSQLILRENGHERHVFHRAQLLALLLHSKLELPLTSASKLQRRKAALDILQLFQLLEKNGVTSEDYNEYAMKSEDKIQLDLAGIYRKYQDLLMQHNATSWDGLVLEMLTMCGVRIASVSLKSSMDKEFSKSVLREYTDVVVDDVQKMTPAMATLVGHLCGQPSVQSSASFSRVLFNGDECPRMKSLERQLLSTAAGCTYHKRTLNRIILENGDEALKKKAKMQAFAQQILTQQSGTNTKVAAPVPLKCWRFGSCESEENYIGTFLAERMKDGATNVTVLCPTYADAHRITLAFQRQGLVSQLDGDQFLAKSNYSGARIHLFDEPGVNAVYSLLCALHFPSDSRHLYNVLRSTFFSFPAELLSWLMEKEQQSYVDLFQVLETFVACRAKSLGTSFNQTDGGEHQLPQAVSCQLEAGLLLAEGFVDIIKRLRTKCHELTAAEIVQTFLESTGRMEALLHPNSLEEERESLALADFLRELENAQTVVRSDRIPFVVPYLQQLRETDLSSSALWRNTSIDASMKTAAKDYCIRVLPLTASVLQCSASFVNDKAECRRHVLVLMSMRDSKFPGRMKRLTLPLPYDLLAKPFPVQSRIEHLEQCEQLAYEALTRCEYDEVILSFPELGVSLSSKREVLSRTFQPIWHEGDQPGTAHVRNESDATSSRTDGSRLIQSALMKHVTPEPHQSLTFGLSEMARVMRSDGKRISIPGARIAYEPRHLSYSQISEYLRCPRRYYLSRVMKLNGDISISMMFGRALHEGIAAFANSLAAAQLDGEITEERKAFAAARAEEAFRQSWSGDGYGLFNSEDQASVLFDRGIISLNQFIETHYNDSHLDEIVYVEHPFTCFIPRANMHLRGVWDRIDRVSNPNINVLSSFVIKEFKSNITGTERKMDKQATESFQLKLYMYAFCQVFGEAPYGAKLQEIGGNYSQLSSKARGVKCGKVGDGFVPFSEKAAQEAEDTIVEVVGRLRLGDFEPTPSYIECAFCPYAGSACHFTTDEALQER
ncbi:hypothetical protein PsorP6_007482 [Peronosclerospora sorghi]|uniref:Uncharacterized protein n=1 Tax=Peronosclerospora sorghi TaxID=230839 RepID=A0ACC0WAU2_9STRA|nr:hypothetical protein PsorP6_007482 [Peronosclerospora sorghi]